MIKKQHTYYKLKEVADMFILVSASKGYELSKNKLTKMLYILNGIYCINYKKGIFRNRFYADSNKGILLKGISSIYDSYKHCFKSGKGFNMFISKDRELRILVKKCFNAIILCKDEELDRAYYISSGCWYQSILNKNIKIGNIKNANPKSFEDLKNPIMPSVIDNNDIVKLDFNQDILRDIVLETVD